MTIDPERPELPLTPAQTVGPYFSMSLTPGSTHLVPQDHPDAITIAGKLVDGDANAIKEGMIEIWQADPEGRYPNTPLPVPDGTFTGLGACHTSDDGSFEFITLKPGPVPGVDGGTQAPHINVSVNGLGILKPLRTRIYFSDEKQANAEDPVLLSVEESRRVLLVGRVDGRKVSFDISLQGDSETPFFKV